jgi:hypothetical protein
MLQGETLIPGQHYFLCALCAANPKIPLVETYVYLGRNLDTKRARTPGADEWYFQDPQSYFAHGIFASLPPDIPHDTFVADRDSLRLMYDLAGLIDRLTKLRDSASDPR